MLFRSYSVISREEWARVSVEKETIRISIHIDF